MRLVALWFHWPTTLPSTWFSFCSHENIIIVGFNFFSLSFVLLFLFAMTFFSNGIKSSALHPKRIFFFSRYLKMASRTILFIILSVISIVEMQVAFYSYIKLNFRFNIIRLLPYQNWNEIRRRKEQCYFRVLLF